MHLHLRHTADALIQSDLQGYPLAQHSHPDQDLNPSLPHGVVAPWRLVLLSAESQHPRRPKRLMSTSGRVSVHNM